VVADRKYNYLKAQVRFKERSYVSFAAARISIWTGWLLYLIYDYARLKSGLIQSVDYFTIVLSTFIVWYTIIILLSDVYYRTAEEATELKASLIMNSLREIKLKGIKSLREWNSKYNGRETTN
jgi:hypothetical protein